ncbi:MAG: MBL fold metallo-hydrolase [Desulfobacteraceae bacterium]|nr:MBL fold metallo-hydrolase [Desulfobacteraceae bacterium]
MKHSLELRKAVVGPWQINTYAFVCPKSGESLLIDPGAEPQSIKALLDGSRPKAIVVTHSHPDHIGALPEMREMLQVPVMAHSGTLPSGNLMVDADHWLQDGISIVVGSFRLLVYHTPGHTDDQICLGVESDPRYVVGDTIFENGPGKTWTVDGFKTTLRTLRRVVMHWPDEAICYPGHGASFRLKDKRADIEAFLAKNHGNFYGDAMWKM